MWRKIRIWLPWQVAVYIWKREGVWGLNKAAKNWISERIITLGRVRNQGGSKCGIRRTDQKRKGDEKNKGQVETEYNEK